MSDYIPQNRDARYTWSDTFRSYFQTNAVALGYEATDVSELDNLWNSYSGDYTALAPAKNAFDAALTSLDTSESAFIAHVRALAAEIQVNPDVTDVQRSAAGLPIRSTTRTPAAVPVTRPVAEVDASQRLQHLINFRDQGATNKAKPAGVRGCEIWCVIGPAPASVADARYLGTDTATPYLAAFDPADAGKSAHYFLRWVNTRNQPGPWSETVTATIGG